MNMPNDKELQEHGWKMTACFANNAGKRIICWQLRQERYLIKFYGKGSSDGEIFLTKEDANGRIKGLVSGETYDKSVFHRDIKKEEFFGIRKVEEA